MNHIEAMKQALEALENMHIVELAIEDLQSWNKAVKSLRQAIEQAEKQEPVAVVAVDGVGQIQMGWLRKPQHNDKLYTTPPAAPVQEPVSIKKMAEERGMNLPSEFVPKRDESKAAIRSLTDQCAELIQERDKLQKRVWQYEKLTPLAAPVQETVAWKNAAIRLGEELSSVGPDGYYNMTAHQWLDWAMDQQPQGKNSLSAAQRQWVGLTDEDLSVCDEDGVILARYWEAKLREKNT